MQNYEKLGAFYLGKEFDPQSGETTENIMLYDAKDLTTHGVIVGMTGSGKTGLAISLIEEAAIDGVPVIAIDPKGDLGNLLLAFPGLSAQEFRPWVDEAEATRKGMDVDAYAKTVAETWRNGLAKWGQEPSRIRKYLDAVDLAIYTPGNAAGRPLQILRSFAAPPAALINDTSGLRDRIMSAVSGLLGLVGIAADPVQSREHILLSTILDHAWQEGRDMGLEDIIQDIQKPPFERIGVFDLESFFPAKERFGLAMALNNLLASPGFSAWMEGEPLDIQRLLYTVDGKPRVSVLYIAHLSDAERMFFVTLLLSEMLSWVRSQSGTTSLRALLYMDEIYGFFPPTANPPSKTPMLTLLKQARAFGVGVLLSTQNPVDLDYKGLANCGTWFIGRLQTERDKARVIEGLEGAMAGGQFDRQKTGTMLSALGTRVFLMRNVNEDEPILFQTRWALSYLRGPLTLPQIQKLNGTPVTKPARRSTRVSPAPTAEESAPVQEPTSPSPKLASAKPGAKPLIPADLPEFFLRPKKSASGITYRPMMLGVSKLHFVDLKASVDVWLPYSHLAPLSDDGRQVDWEQSSQYGDLKSDLARTSAAGAVFADLPAGASNAKAYVGWKKALEEFIYQTVTLELLSCVALKLTSQPGETEGDFRARLSQVLREKRDQEVEKLRARYAPKLQVLQDRLRSTQDRVAREKAQYGQHQVSTAIGFGATLLGALMGRKVATVGNMSRAASAMKAASRVGKEKDDVARAGESVEVVQQRLQEMNAEAEREIAEITSQFDLATMPIEKARIRPRKSDIGVGDVALVWVPWAPAADGIPERI